MNLLARERVLVKRKNDLALRASVDLRGQMASYKKYTKHDVHEYWSQDIKM